MCAPPTLPLLLGFPFSAFDVDYVDHAFHVDHIFLQGLGQSNSASFLHMFNSDLPTSHISCCAPECISFGAMLFSPES